MQNLLANFERENEKYRPTRTYRVRTYTRIREPEREQGDNVATKRWDVQIAIMAQASGVRIQQHLTLHADGEKQNRVIVKK